MFLFCSAHSRASNLRRCFFWHADGSHPRWVLEEPIANSVAAARLVDSFLALRLSSFGCEPIVVSDTGMLPHTLSLSSKKACRLLPSVFWNEVAFPALRWGAAQVF